jgi:hypothetical protein
LARSRSPRADSRLAWAISSPARVGAFDDGRGGVHLGRAEQRFGLLQARGQRCPVGFAGLAGAVVGDLAEFPRGLRTHAQGGIDACDRFTQVGGQRRLPGEVAVNGGLGAGQQITIDHAACQIGGVDPGQQLFQRGADGRIGCGDLVAHTSGQAAPHRLDVDAFQHRLLERGHLLQFRAALFGNRPLRARLHQAIHRHRKTTQQRQPDHRRGHQRGAVAGEEARPAVAAGRRHRRQRRALQEPLQIRGQFGDRGVARIAIVGHRPGDHPIQFLAQCALQVAIVAGRRGRGALRGELLGRQAQDAAIGGAAVAHAGAAAGQQLEQQHAQRVDVAARIEGGEIAFGLFRAHVVRGAGALLHAGQRARGGGGDAEVDDLGRGAAVDAVDQDIAGFQVPVDHALVVGVLDAFADADEQCQPLAQVQSFLRAEHGDRPSFAELHGEERHTVVGGAGVVDLGDGRMPHLRQQLPFDFEVSQVARFHAMAAQQFQRHGPAHRFQLFRPVHLAHAATSEQGLQPVASQPRARREGLAVRGHVPGQARRQKLGGFRVRRWRCWIHGASPWSAAMVAEAPAVATRTRYTQRLPSPRPQHGARSRDHPAHDPERRTASVRLALGLRGGDPGRGPGPTRRHRRAAGGGRAFARGRPAHPAPQRVAPALPDLARRRRVPRVRSGRDQSHPPQ